MLAKPEVSQRAPRALLLLKNRLHHRTWDSAFMNTGAPISTNKRFSGKQT
jgi:hypothetical protein